MEIRLVGIFYDGISSRAHPAVFLSSRSGIRFESADGALLASCSHSQLRLSPPLGQLPAVIETENGFRFETRDFESFAFLRGKKTSGDWLHRVEANAKLVIFTTLFLVVSLVLLYKVVLPRYSNKIARQIPKPVVEALTKSTEDLFLKRGVVSKMDLPADITADLETAVSQAEAHFPGKKIHVTVIEDLEIANAFILPNGHIYFTLKFLKLTHDSDEILAVLLHELGHDHHYHGLQGVVESSVLSAALVFLSGGVDWTQLPATFLSLGYSRNSEREADQFAIHHLMEMGKDPGLLGQILRKMHDTSENDLPAFLSTHPDFRGRLEMSAEASHQFSIRRRR